MASLLERKCAISWFLRDDEETAARCGRLNGAVLGLILGLVVGLAAFSAARNAKASYVGAAAAAIGVFALLMLAFVSLGGFLGRRSFQGVQGDIEARMAQGMTRADALREVQSQENAIAVASGAVTAGSMIGVSKSSR